MKTPIYGRILLSLVVCASFLCIRARAQLTQVTATGVVPEVLSTGVVANSGLGRAALRGAVQIIRIQSPDARLSGKMILTADGTVNPDGSANLQGSAFLEIGTWDPSGTIFSSIGTLWDGSWVGVMQPDFTWAMTITAAGVGGTTDGWHLSGTMTRTGAASLIDRNAVYQLSGTVGPLSASTPLIQDNFSQGTQSWEFYSNCGAGWKSATNQQLRVWANWSNCPAAILDNFAFAQRVVQPWTLTGRQTLECLMDVDRVSENTTNAIVLLTGSHNFGEYGFHLTQVGVGLHKWVDGDDLTFFWWDGSARFARTNLTLQMTLTRVLESLQITCRVLDKANQNAVLLERSFLDTPGVDSSLTYNEFRNLTGIRNVTLRPDSGRPTFQGNKGVVCIWQSTDGRQPPMEAFVDNFILRRHDQPPIAIAPAVRLSWPAPSGSRYRVLGASALEGPWLEVRDGNLPGTQSQTVPISSGFRFYRLHPAPIPTP